MPESLPEDWRDDKVVGHFLRYVVPIYLDLRHADRPPIQVIFTAFIFSVRDRWLLMTAGHCITEIEQCRADGYEIHECNLLDSLGSDAVHAEPVPLNYDSAKPTHLGTDPTYDYGMLVLPLNVRALLEANNVRPFTEAHWEDKLEQPDFHKLLGLPSERVLVAAENRRSVTAMFPAVEKLDGRPEDEGFPETNAPMFYGRLKGDLLTKVQGMSGGPILAVKAADGKLHYRLVAMQVSAVRSKYISGMMMRPLGKLIQEKIDRRDRAG
jgi:hypothetical protein